MRHGTICALSGGVLLVALVVPVAADPTTCGNRSGSVQSSGGAPWVDLTSAQGTRAGSLGIETTANATWTFTIRDGATGGFRGAFNGPGIGGVKSSGLRSGSRTRERAVAVTSDVVPHTTCWTLGFLSFDGASGRTYSYGLGPALQRDNDNLFNIAVSGAGDTDGDGWDDVVVEVRSRAANQLQTDTEQTGNPWGRSIDPQPERARVLRADGRTGKVTVIEDQPLHPGPGPLYGFYSLRGRDALLQLHNPPGGDGSSSLVEATQGGRRLWQTTIPTLTEPGTVLALRGGPLVITEVSATIPVVGTRVLASAPDFRLSALDGATGKLRWSRDLPQQQLAVQVLDGDLITHDTGSGITERLAAKDGRVLWSAKLGGQISPTVAGDFNGDRTTDLVMPVDPSNTSPLISGATGERLLPSAVRPLFKSASWIGDVNHNGYADFLTTGQGGSGLMAYDGNGARPLWEAAVAMDFDQLTPVNWRPGRADFWLVYGKRHSLVDGRTGTTLWSFTTD